MIININILDNKWMKWIWIDNIINDNDWNDYDEMKYMNIWMNIYINDNEWWNDDNDEMIINDDNDIW